MHFYILNDHKYSYSSLQEGHWLSYGKDYHFTKYLFLFIVETVW
jgi:hypothetical protein